MLAFLICCLVNDDTHGDVGDDAAQAVHQSRVTPVANPQLFLPLVSMDPFLQEVTIMPILIIILSSITFPMLILILILQFPKEAMEPLRPAWERKPIVQSSAAG